MYQSLFAFLVIFPCVTADAVAILFPRKARQWLDLVSRSGTPLFVSVERKALTPEIRKTLQGALLAASKPAPLGEPLDWMTSATPGEWKLGGERAKFDWS